MKPAAAPTPTRKSRRTQRVTLADIAHAAGVARTTVSDIINRGESGRFSEETCQKVHKAVAELGYTPSKAAQVMARGRSGEIGLLLTHSFMNPYFARLAGRVEGQARAQGLGLKIAVMHGGDESDGTPLRSLLSDHIDGLLVGPIYREADLASVQNALPASVPVVLFGSEFKSSYDEIVLDHEAGARMATQHLIDMGHRRIGYLCAPTVRDQDAPAPTLSVFLEIVKAKGQYDPEWVLWRPDRGAYEVAFQAAMEFGRRWQAAPPQQRPTAVVCHNDQVAMTAIAAFGTLGVRVPLDISIIGFDNLPESAYLVPALTTIDTQADSQAVVAVERLIERLANPRLKNIVNVATPQLVVRDSVRDLNG